MHRENHRTNGEWTPPATIAAILLAVLLAALFVPGPVAAADEYASYKLVDIKEYWPAGPASTAPTAARIDKITHDANGGSIEFTMRSQDTSGDCKGAVQHFKFSWVFNKDVSTLSGKAGDPLVLMSTKWEGDGATKCLDENPFVWINSGGSWGKNPGEGVVDYTFRMDFFNPNSGENRVYFKGETKSSPTIIMNSVQWDNGGFTITPAIRFLDAQLNIVYVYQRVPDAPTNTVTTAPQTTAATTTTAPQGTTVAGTVASPATTTPATRSTTPGTGGTGGGSGGCGWSGTWSTNYGEMTLSQAGNLVTGTYAMDDGVIEGTVSGTTLSGRWSEAPSYREPNDAGEFVFTMGPTCGSFTGTWGYGSASTGSSWSGTLSGAGGTAGTTATTATTATTTTTTTAATTAATTPATTTATSAATTSTGGSTGGSTSTSRNGCPATGMLLYIDPWAPSPGQTVEIPVWCCNAQDLANMDLTVLYDPAVLTFVSARKGGLLGSDFLLESNDLGGQVKISFAGTKGVSGSGAIAILTFRVAGAIGASTTIGATVNTASNSGGGKLNVPTAGGTVTVKPPNPQNPEGRPCGPTSLTALKALQMAVGKIPVDMAYDVTRDGAVNSADARELLRLATEEVCVL